MAIDNCRLISLFTQYHDEANKDICACVNFIRDIALYVVTDHHELSSEDQDWLSLLSSDRFDVCLEDMLSQLVLISIKQQTQLLHDHNKGQAPERIARERSKALRASLLPFPSKDTQKPTRQLSATA